MKKILISIVIIVIIAAIGYIAWIYFGESIFPGSGNGNNNPPPPTVNDPEIPLPITLTNDKVLDYWVNKSNNEIYYIKTNGQISKITADNNIEEISTQKIDNLTSFKSSFNGKYFLISFGPVNNPFFSVLDIEEFTWQPLPSGTISADWDPKNNNLAYIVKRDSSSSINLLNFSNNKVSEITRLNQKGLELEWLASEEIYLTQRPSHKFLSSIWALNTKTKTLRNVIKEEPGLMVKWSDNGKLGIKFTNRIRENRLSLINENNQTLNNFNFGVTLPSKCTFSERDIYCAVLEETPPGITLPDDYLKRKFYPKDMIIAVKANNPVEFDILFDNIETDIDAIKLKQFKDNLYFINRYDNKLYSLKING